MLKTIEIDIGKESWHPIKIPSSGIALASQLEETGQNKGAPENRKRSDNQIIESLAISSENLGV